MIPTANRLHDVQEYYFSIKLKEVKSLVEQGQPIINLGIGSPDLHPPESVLSALKNADVHGYQSYIGIPELRQSMADFYQRFYEVSLDPVNEVLPLMGSKEGILHISMAFLNKGDQVLIPDPGYPTYSAVTRLVEAQPLFYKLAENNNWWPDFDQIEKLNLEKVKLMWVNYPHMPTGSQANEKVFRQLVEFGLKHNILIVNDNPYSFILNDHPTSLLAQKGAKEICIELNSLSKSFNMAGWRVGMVVGGESYLKSILKVKSNMDSGMYFGIQKGAIEALNLTADWFSKMNKIYEERRNIIWQICDILHCSYDKNSTGMFVWAKLPNGEKSNEMTDMLLYKYNVFVTPGTVFGNMGEGYIRFSLCIDIAKMNEVEKRLKESVR